MTAMLEIALRGEVLQLHAQRALYWPARQRLLIADLHLGKADHFRAAGIALPAGGTQLDLQRLATLLAQTQAKSLWILGDMVHGALLDTAWRTQWDTFRAQHAQIELVLIDGNHDRALRSPQALQSLGIDRSEAQCADGPFLFVHDSVAENTASTSEEVSPLAIGGHHHPVARVPGFRQRFAAFALMSEQLILPAFSAFTGGTELRQARAVWACVGDVVLQVRP